MRFLIGSSCPVQVVPIALATVVMILGTERLHGQIDDRFSLTLSETEGVVDQVVVVELDLTVDEDDIQGWIWGVCHEDLVELEDGEVAEDEGVEDSDFTFHSVEYHDEGWSVGALLNVTLGLQFPIGDYELYDVRYTCVEAGDATVEFCDSLELGGYEAPVRIVFGSEEVEPEVEDGRVEIVDPEFLRGDVDGDGDVDAIVDGSALLEWAFRSGAAPLCLDAADVDDDGTVQPLLDVLFLYRWAYVDGDEPPEPGPEECGVDPTTGDGWCATTSNDCA